jgi:hypothetical protein
MEDSVYNIFEYITKVVSDKIDDKLCKDDIDKISRIYNELLIRNTVMNIMSPQLVSIINKNKI